MEYTRILLAGILSAVLSYLIGSLNFAVIISRILAGDDVRRHGSGSAGMTNMLRTYGPGPAALTALGDFFKGIIAILVSGMVFRGLDAGDVDPIYIAAVFAILGHMFPLFFHFKGGKGVMTALGILIAINPSVFFIVVIIALPIVFITRTVSIGSLTGAIAFLVLNCYWVLQSEPMPLYPLLGTVIISVLVLVMHRDNIKRLNAGTENRFGSKKGGAK